MVTQNKKKFRINSKHIGLTYPRCNATPEEVLNSHKSRKNLIYCLVAQEKHQDGENHLHCYLYFEKRKSVENCNFFDYGDYHCSIESLRDPNAWWNYITKDGIWLEHGDKDQALNKTKRGNWLEIITAAENQEDFMDLVKVNFTEKYVLQHEKLEYFARKHYTPKVKEYESDPNYTFVISPCLTNWLQDEFYGTHDRPKSLVLVGPSRTGKTVWARSHGSHNYFCGMVNFKRWNRDASYTVFDDMPFANIENFWKSWFGCQNSFTVTDKYMGKLDIEGRRPFIWLCNELPIWPDMDWKSKNILIVKVTNKLY